MKSGMVEEFTQGLVDTLLESFKADPRLVWFTHTLGGAANRIGELDTAFPHRNAATMIGIGGGWADAADDAPGIALARELYSQIEPYLGGYYTNIDFDQNATAGNYGPAYARLREIKGDFDPSNQFRLNSNIEPAV
jgi:hypothetical protein